MNRFISLIIIFIFISILSFAQKNIEAEVFYKKVPILIGTNKPVIKIKVYNPEINLIELSQISLDISGSVPLRNIKSISVFSSGKGETFKDYVLIGKSSEILFNTTIPIITKINKDASYLWMVVDLDTMTNILGKLKIQCNTISLADGSLLPIKSIEKGNTYRIGNAIRMRYQDNVSVYRIPGITCTNKGTLISVYDNRNKSGGDLQNDIDVGLSISRNGGQTWEPMKVIMDMGEYGGLPNNANGIGDPAILFDNRTNTIWVSAVWQYDHENKNGTGWNGKNGVWMTSQSGFTPERTGQIMMVKSTDDGKTWSKPFNVTKQVKDSTWRLIFQGPGSGICMKNGTLVFAAQYAEYIEDSGNQNNLGKQIMSTIIYSKDHGKTWKSVIGAKLGTNEAQVVELADKSLMLNMRDIKNGTEKGENNGRAVAITKDMGNIWNMHPTTNHILQESDCQGSIIGIDTKVNNKKQRVLLFSNPSTKYGRNTMTVKASFDEGMTWPVANQIMYDEDEGLGYSCLVQIDEKSFGVIYEGMFELYFQKFTLDGILFSK